MIDYVGKNDNITKKKKKTKYAVGPDGILTIVEEDEDIAPVVTTEATKEEGEEWYEGWFQAPDTYKSDNPFVATLKTVGSSVMDVGENLLSGVVGIGESVVDTGAWIFGSAAGLLGQSALKERTSDFIKNDLYDEKELAQAILFHDAYENLTGSSVEDDSLFAHKAGSLTQSAGQLAGTAALSKMGIPWWVTVGTTSFGSEVANALNQGASLETAGMSAAISAGAEILTEKLSGGIKFGGKTLDDVLVKPLTEKISNKVVKSLVNVGIDAFGEGAEEVISQVFSNLGSSLYKEEDLKDILASEEAFDEYIESFIGGAALGGVAGSGKTVMDGQAVELTENEQKVVDQVYKDRVAETEKDGNTLTDKEKRKLYDEVVSEMDKGYISTDTIESVLGGETYKSYRDTVDSEESMKQELDGLRHMESGKMNDIQRDRLAELKAMDFSDTSKRDSLKSQLDNEVLELVKDSRLSESYNERTRRSQAYEADLTKYSAKQQEIVKRAVDSGILNNTNRTHEFVDMIAKISADKGVLFDFTNNAKLKESGFALEGKTVNGFVKDGNISININSAKALNSVVGHEITHVLEGTELYAELQQAVKNYATTKGEYDTRLQALTKLYEGVEGADIDAELTADLIGDYLFTDSDFVNRLSTEHRNVFQKIFDEIKYLWKTATAGSKEARELEKVKRVFEKAYRETSNQSAENAKLRYDVSEDNALYQYIQDSLSGKVSKKSYHKLSDSISDRLASDIEKIVGFSVTGYGNEISPGSIEHINNDHGTNGKSDQSMSDLHDLAKINYVIENYDNIREGKESKEYKNRDGSYAKTIELQKKIDDKFYYVVEAVPDAKLKTLHVVSAYINKNDTFLGVAVPKDPSRYVQDELQSNVSSTNSIPHDTENATKFSLSQKTDSDYLDAVNNDDIAPVRGGIYGKDIAFEGPIRSDVATSQPATENARQMRAGIDPEIEEVFQSPTPEWFTEGAEEAEPVTTVKQQRITRKDLHSGIIDTVKTAFNSHGYDFDQVLKKAKNLSTFSTVDNTPQRVMEKALGYNEGQLLSDLTVNKVAQNETEGIKWLNSITSRKHGLLAQLSEQYGIKPGSKKSAAAQMYAEGFYVAENGDILEYGDKELLADFPDTETRANIKALAKDPRIRQFYDETLAAINESRTRNGYPEIPKLDNYFLHFRAMDDTFSRLGLPFNPNDIRAKDLPTDLNGVTADLKPGQPYFPSAMHRTGKRTSFDLLGGLERYATSAKNQIYHIDDIQTLRALRNYIADSYGQANGLEGLDELTEEEAQEKIERVYDSHLSTFAKFLNEEANILAGKTSLIDRGLEGIIGRRGITFLNTVNGQVGSNMVGMNISSSLTNILPVIQTFAKTNKFDFTKAFAQTVANKVGSVFGKSDGFAENSPVIIRRKGSDRFYRNPWQKAGDAGYILMSAVDNISTELIARTKYNELTRGGMDTQKAHYETDKWVSRLMGDRSLGQMPQLYNSKMLGLVTKFQLEVRNQLDSQFYDTIQEAKASSEDIQNGLARNAKTAAKVASTFVQLAVVQHLFGKAFESVAGYNPAFDIIDVLIKVFGFDDDEESEDTALDNIEEGFLALLDDLPYTSTFTGGGRIPISSALPIGELVTGVDEYGNEKSRWETLGEAAPYYLLPTGYGQLKKTGQGLNMFSDDHPISGSYTDSGNLRFPVEETPWSVLQAGIFGQWSSQNAQDYIDEGRSPLQEKQIQEFIDVGMTIQDYWEYRDGLKGLKTLAEKTDYIDSLDLTVEQKNVLINNIADREEDIDMTDYSDYGGFEEFDFAIKNPEKYEFLQANDISYEMYSANDESKDAYTWAHKNPDKFTLSKAVTGDVVKYKRYTKALSNIKSDKDENGDSISGSRKEKVIDYINNMDAEYGEKIILYKSEYPSDDTYNMDIIDYLNSRNDISYADMETILEELGFTVAPDGTVTWD